jgi:hypothetical protein
LVLALASLHFLLYALRLWQASTFVGRKAGLAELIAIA